MVLECVSKYQSLLGLSGWEITVKFPKKLGSLNSEGEFVEHTADCEAWPHYKQAVLQFSLKKIEPYQILELVVHELLHCHVWELAAFAQSMAQEDPVKLELAEKMEEALTTTLTEIILEQANQAVDCARCSQALSPQEGVGPSPQGGEETEA